MSHKVFTDGVTVLGKGTINSVLSAQSTPTRLNDIGDANGVGDVAAGNFRQNWVWNNNRLGAGWGCFKIESNGDFNNYGTLDDTLQLINWKNGRSLSLKTQIQQGNLGSIPDANILDIECNRYESSGFTDSHVITAMRINRSSNGNIDKTGMGSQIKFSSSGYFSAQHETMLQTVKWKTASSAGTEVAQLTFSLWDSGTQKETLYLDGDGIVKISQGLSNYADDTAAAAGGIPVNGLYRNGSVVMIRVV